MKSCKHRASVRLRSLHGFANSALICGRNATTKQKTQCGASKGRREFTSIWDRWQNDEIHRKSQLAHNWSDAWVRYLDHIGKLMSPIQRRIHKGRDTTIYFTCGGSTKISKRHIYHKDQGTKMQRKRLICSLSRHPPLPAGHQLHPGGTRLNGLRTGNEHDWKDSKWSENEKMRQHRLAFSMKSIQAPRNWLSPASNDKSEVVTVNQKA